MKDTWDLSILYSGLEDPNIKKDKEILNHLVGEFNALPERFDKMQVPEFLKEYVSLSEKIAEVSGKLERFGFFTFATDTSNSKAQSLMEQVETISTSMTASDAAIQHKICEIPNLSELVETEEELREYSYFFRKMKEESRYLLSDKEEALLAKMNLSGGKAWEDLQSSMTSSVTAGYRGNEIPLSEVRNLAYDPDPAVRKEAYEAELRCYEKIKTSVAYSLNSIKLQVINECELRGYESPLDKALKDANMKRETLDAMLSAIEEYKGCFQKYLRAKAKYLGYKDGLPWWEMFAPVGKNDKKYTIQEAREYLVTLFTKIDSDIGNLMKTAFEEDWVDFYPGEGKMGGAFDESVPSAKQSRVLTNFSGSFTDLDTLAHELGHAFHDRQVFVHKQLNQGYSMPVAETASTFNEQLLVSTAIGKAETKEEKLNLIESQISDATQIILDILSRYLFETAVFATRKEEFMDADTLCDIMRKAQLEAYGDGLAKDTLHPYMWLCKCHYYSASISFYNFPYAFGGLLARGLYAKYQEEGGETFFPKYKEMLRNTSVMDVEECVATMGIDLTDKHFWESGLKSLSDEINQFIQLVED